MSTPVWRKSSHSGTGGQGDEECVEVAPLSASIGVRDSKNPDAGNLAISGATFRTLLGKIKRGELDR
jgi:hypothetical protein